MDKNANAPAGTRARHDGRENYPHATATSQPAATSCPCRACADLLAECGEHFAMYADRLLQRGWAGTMSPVERAYVVAHRSEAQRTQAAVLSARMRNQMAAATPKPPVPDGETGATGSQVGTGPTGGPCAGNADDQDICTCRTCES